jgi:hypothetical protein
MSGRQGPLIVPGSRGNRALSLSGMVVCSLCGVSSTDEDPSRDATRPADESMPLTWVTSYEHGHRRVYCDRCAREHLRGIESKLDSEWW